MFSIPFFRRVSRGSTDLSTNVVESAVGRGKDSPIAKYQVRSVVSAGLEIRGNIVAREGAVIDGVLHGDVTVTAANAALLVRSTARIFGNIEAPQVLISGEVVGDITARFVRLYPGSRVYGRVSSARLLVDDGAMIDNESIKVDATTTLCAPQAEPTPAQPHALMVSGRNAKQAQDATQTRLNAILETVTATERRWPRAATG